MRARNWGAAQLKRLIFVNVLLIVSLPAHAVTNCPDSPQITDSTTGLECSWVEHVTVYGGAKTARDVAGGASDISAGDLEKFEVSDIVRALRRVPGVSLQTEDGWALRPNISIRGTATERSSRVTLLEDGVLIAPAPYAASSAYYFPTFGRIHSVEILKGPASITQGPSTIGGAINMRSTPIPNSNGSFLQAEYGSDSTWRVHGWYGGGSERTRFIAETHQWRSDGFQTIDRSDAKTGLDKKDYLAKLSFISDESAEVYQQFDIKFQYSEEVSQQSYLGLTDTDFKQDGLRRYGASLFDEMQNEHDQVVLRWYLETQAGTGMTVTAYSNNTERAWYKTEGMDFDGSENPQSFKETSWSKIVAAVNEGGSLGGLDSEQLQAILDGADTPEGSIQLRNNAREYYSRGVQMVFDASFNSKSTLHRLQAGLRYHEDEEDRLQRNDNYQQLDGQLTLNELGLEGNAGNRVQGANAWAAYMQDRIEWGKWTLTPGLRYENIELSRIRWNTKSVDPASRDPDNFRDSRDNEFDIWLPGMGALYQLDPSTRIVAGIHRGFATPTNAPGVDPEESTNYEFGMRRDNGSTSVEAIFFFNDYENLVGVCTNSSGGNCDPGDAFNGEGVHIPGLEFTFSHLFETESGWELPLQISYTWMKAEFQSGFESEYFGQVNKGDPVPYVPENQLWAALGLQRGPWSFDLSGNFLGSVCTEASCGTFEKTESATIFDLSAHYRINNYWQIFAVAENLSDEIYIAARDPYGARPNKPRTVKLGAKFDF